MRGFGAPTSLEAALALLGDGRLGPLPVEEVDLDEATGRVLAEEVRAAVDVPAFPRACMDGWALRAADTFGASTWEPATLAVLPGSVLPGQPAPGPVEPGSCVKIMTGARLPRGADAVVPWERAELRGERLRLVAASPPGKHVARPGEDVRAGTALLAAGRRLRPADVGLLASVGRARVRVRARPRLLALPSGDELLDPARTPVEEAAARLAEGRTFESNGRMLLACARALGLPARRGPALPDRREAIEAALLGADADVVLTTGATSTGQEDVLPLVLAERGELWLHGVDLRPGHPVGLGRLGPRFVGLLPGNPAAAWTCFHLLVRPALRLLEGEPPAAALVHPSRRGRLAARITSSAGRTDVVRVRLDRDGAVTPLPGGSAALLSASQADGLVIVPRALEGLEAGTEVDVLDLGP